MSNIVKKIKMIEKLYHVTGCSLEQINEAQKELGVIFSEEYKDYIKEYGAISFYGTEWTGLNIEGHLNVIEATRRERSVNADFPEDCYVIENQGIDGLIAISNSSGKIYLLQYDKKELIGNNLEDYLDICLKRKV